MNVNKDLFIKKINEVSDKLNLSSNFVNSEYILDFKDVCNSLTNEIDDIISENRLLRIGVVGEVKAGKSSFVNALIFDGEEVLPKAATPMTAALTKLSYSEQSSAKIVFYTQYDWERIDELSSHYDEEFKKLREEYFSQNKGMGMIIDDSYLKNVINERIPNQFKSCKELTDMVAKNAVNVDDYLGKVKEINSNDIYGELKEYIGAEGKFTPLVKHIELKLNNDLLKEIELIDTPGLNDPILSRSDTTKKFLKNCDVVFLLSYSGQFLTNEDIQFISNTLPQEGIGKAVLIGSKIDSGILDYPKRKATLKEAYSISLIKYVKQAKVNIEACIASNNRSEAIIKIEESLPPKFISSMMYSIAKKIKDGIPLNEEESHIIKNYKKRFEDFNDSYEYLMSISGVRKIKKDVFDDVKSKKEETINRKSELVLNGKKSQLLSILEDINIQANQNLRDINIYDKDKLQEKLEMLKYKMGSIRSKVKGIFDLAAIDSKKILNEIASDIEKEVDNYTNINVGTKSKERFVTQGEGFLGLKKTTYRVTDTISTASVAEVIANLRKYITRCKKVANEEFERLINIDNIKRDVKEVVIGAFDLSDKNFNENDILNPIEIVMKKITIPSININVNDYDEMILKSFSGGIVEGNAINELFLQQEKVLQEISSDIQKVLEETSVDVEVILNEQASLFVDNIIDQLSSNIEIIESRLEDKENSIKEFERFISDIYKYKKEIISLKV